MPWTIFTSFDGNPEGGGFNPPQTGSYAAQLESAFLDYRLLTSNTLIPAGPITVNGLDVTFYCQYNQSQGFIIFAKDSDDLPISFRINDCNWITEASNVHGYGVIDVELNIMRPKYFNVPDFFYAAYISDATPNLTVSKYFSIYSDQLTRERRLPSFRNIAENIGSGNENFNNELAVLPIILSKIGRYTSNTAVGDPTTVSVREGSEAQFLEIYMVDNNSRYFVCGNPFGSFLNDDTVPPEIRFAALNSSINYRSPTMMNYLLFGFDSIFVPNTVNIFQNRVPLVMSQSGPGLPNYSTLVHWGHNNGGDTSGWVSYNTSFFNKINDRSSSATIVSRLKLVAASAAGTPTAVPHLCLVPIHLTFPSGAIEATPDVASISILSASLGTETVITYTFTSAQLNALPTLGYQIFEYMVPTAPLDPAQLYSVSQLVVPATTVATFTSTGGIIDPGYIPPFGFTKYAEPDVICLCDDLIHEFEIIF